jgi:hypothetical protein
MDPLGFAAGNVNLYAYCNEFPVGSFDPYGLEVGTPYPTADAAAIAAIKEYNPQSIQTDREYGGYIFEHQGHFYHTPPKIGERGAWKLKIHPEDFSRGPNLKAGQIPSEAKPAGVWHTHGRTGGWKWLPGVGLAFKRAERFSCEDEVIVLLTQAPLYLGTPRGFIKKLRPLQPGESPLMGLLGPKFAVEEILVRP